MRIFRVIHEVTDQQKAAEGYARLLGTPGRNIPRASRHYFDVGDVILAIVNVQTDHGGRAPQTAGRDLYLAVPGGDLEAIHARARELGWLSKNEVHDEPGGEIGVRPWGERSFYVVDPWGNGLCFVDEATLFTGR
jgi:hypothetical protein